MVLFATTRVDKAREPVGSTTQARYVKLTLPGTTIGPVGEGIALDKDEVEDAISDDGPAVEFPELVAVEEPVVVVVGVETADVLELALMLEFAICTFAIGGLNLYIWRRLPAPQYSVVLPGHTMLQSPWFATKALPAFGLDPQ